MPNRMNIHGKIENWKCTHYNVPTKKYNRFMLFFVDSIENVFSEEEKSNSLAVDKKLYAIVQCFDFVIRLDFDSGGPFFICLCFGRIQSKIFEYVSILIVFVPFFLTPKKCKVHKATMKSTPWVFNLHGWCHVFFIV